MTVAGQRAAVSPRIGACRACIAVLFAMILLALSGRPTQAEGQILVRAEAMSPEAANLIFEWDTPTSVRVERTGRILRLRFGQPVTADLLAPLVRLAPWLSDFFLGDQPGEVRLELCPGVSADLAPAPDGTTVLALRRSARGSVSQTEGEKPPHPAISLHSGAHRGFGRLVVEGAPTLGLEVTKLDGEVRMVASQPVPERDWIAQASPLSRWVAGATVDDGAFVLSLSPGVTVREERTGQGKLVLDFRSPDDAPRPAPVFVARPDRFGSGHPREAMLGAAPAGMVAPLAAARPSTPSDVSLPPPLSRVAASDAARAGSTVDVAPAAGPPAGTVMPARAEQDAIVSFDWRKPVPAAVFERAGVLWLVFGGSASDLVDVTLPPDGGVEPRLRELPRLEREGLVAFRFLQRRPGPVSVGRDGATWRLYPGQPSPKGGKKVVLAREGDGRLVLGVAGRLGSVDDPEAGDRLDLLLLDEPGVGLAAAPAFVDLEFIPASTGVVWRTLADGVRATLAKGRLELSRAKGPDPAVAKGAAASAVAASSAPAGHHAGRGSVEESSPASAHHGTASPALERAVSALSVSQAPPLAMPSVTAGGSVEPLKLAGIDKNARSLAHRRRALQGDLPGLSGEAALAARHELARLLLSDLLAAEALAVLDAATPADGGVAASLAERQTALRAAAELLLGRGTRAAELLEGVPDERDPEIPLWRAATLAALEQWDAAAEALAKAGRAWADYPPRLRFRLGLTAATILARAERVDPALSVVDQLTPMAADSRERSALALLKGGLLARDVRGKGASSAFAVATHEKGLETRITADFLDTLSALERKASPAGEVLRRLSRQRLLWRGHEREPAMLDELAGLQADEGGDLAAAFETWQTALDREHDEALDGRIRERMRHALERTLTATTADAPDPVAALDLYRLHPTLLPQGEAGRRLAGSLASRLGVAGLPAQAASLLDERSAAGAPAEEAAVLLEVARHRLAADEPDAARAALERLADTDPVSTASRRLVSAETSLALGRPDDAYRELEKDVGPEASDLRASALWRLAAWPRLRSELLGQEAAADKVPADPNAGAERRLRLAVAAARVGDEVSSVASPLPPSRQDAPAVPLTGLLATLSATAPMAGDPRSVMQELGPKIAVLREGLSAPGREP